MGHADFQDDDYEYDDPMFRKIWQVHKKDDTEYSLVCRFYSDTNKIESMSLIPDNNEEEYAFVKNELLP